MGDGDRFPHLHGWSGKAGGVEVGGVSEPIWIDCEGSGCRAHFAGDGVGICSMCGALVDVDGRNATPHERQDILAMLKRGDFS